MKMITEQEKAFQEWMITGPDYGWSAEEVFCAGWEAHVAATATSRTVEREAAEKVGRAIEKQCCRAEIMGRAYEAFRDGRDETARLYRELTNEIFGNPEPQTPLF